MSHSFKFSARRKSSKSSFSELNMTPLIDVMTVLLALFMIAAPMMTTGVSLDLPKGDGNPLEEADRAINISIDAASKIYLGSDIVNPDMLVEKLKVMQKQNPALRIVISGDKATSYGQVIELMSLLRLAGISKVGLKTGGLMEIEEVKAAKKK